MAYFHQSVAQKEKKETPKEQTMEQKKNSEI